MVSLKVPLEYLYALFCHITLVHIYWFFVGNRIDMHLIKTIIESFKALIVYARPLKFILLLLGSDDGFE